MTDRPPNRCVSVALSGAKELLLTYALPEGVDPEGLTGCRVQVPLGNRSVVGVVVATNVPPPEKGTLKPINDILDRSPSIPPELLELTRWIADYYLAPWGDVLRAALPAGLLQEPSFTATWTGPELVGQWPEQVQKDNALRKAASLLSAKGKAPLSTLKKSWGRGGGLLANLRSLEELGLCTLVEKSALDREQAHTVEVVSAAQDASLEAIPKRAAARRRLLATLLASNGEAAWETLRADAKTDRSTLRSLEEAGLVTVKRVPRELHEFGFDPRQTGDLPPLVHDQQTALDRVREVMDSGKWNPLLLTGLPGTGKTRVYIEALRETLAHGKGAILMVPEIGLTPQVVARIRAALDEPVVVLHSGLSAARRVAAWREVLEGRARVVVGPRSAIFAPVKDLGLIVVDEEHEESYKQQDPAPRYHARDVALVRGQRNGAAVLLVSATPSFESIRLVDEGQLEQLKLTRRFGTSWPIVTVLDRRREEADAPYIGAHLAREIDSRAKKGEGVVLLITRRGYAPVLTCGDCGSRVECPNCSVPLTYHGGRHPQLRCHLCGISKRVPDDCPECHSSKLRPLGAGTQRIEDEVQRRFPALAPVRMDADTTRGHGEHERILKAFSEGDAGLLLGTQVVAKGHDFAHVTLVGVVNADPVLFQPDFRAAERAFRLLVQAAGRAGRGERPGEVIVQTLDPENPVFDAIMTPDLEGFAREQLDLRKELNYPPYVRMAMVTVTSTTPDRAEKGANDLAAAIRRSGKEMTLRGPVPAFVARVKRQWRWRLMLSTPRESDPQGKSLRENLRRVMREVKLPPGTASTIDIDPLEVV